VTEAAVILLAYLLGSIPTGLLLAKMQGVDIRTTGSGNIGATNVYRTLGRATGVMTLVGDCLKGLIPVLVARRLGLAETWVAAAGLAAFLGHVYTVFLGFKGGKGVATALGVFLGISPASIGIALLVFILVLLRWHYVSLASIAAAAAMPLFVMVLERRALLVATALVISAVVILKHRDNITRLRAGSESKFRH
jgi:acyl phosphate:glycerol-3-phosphate acyltransferase